MSAPKVIEVEVSMEAIERLIRRAIEACGEDMEAVNAYVTKRLSAHMHEIAREIAA